MNSESDPREGGFVASFHRLGDTLLQVVTTRLEIISTELKEERLNLVRLVLVALTVLFCLQVGLIFALLFVVLPSVNPIVWLRSASARWSCCSARWEARCG